MAFCRRCGARIDDQAVVCPYCGVPQGRTASSYDSGSMGWGVLGFFVPIAGLILYLVWKDTKPLSSRMAGKGALISVIVSAALYVLSFLLLAIA